MRQDCFTSPLPTQTTLPRQWVKHKKDPAEAGLNQNYVTVYGVAGAS